MAAGCPSSRQKKKPPLLTFSAAGEILPSPEIIPLLGSPAKTGPFSELAPFLLSRNLTLADFSGAVEFGCQPLARDQVLRWKPQWLSALSQSNIRLLSLADDHALDCGREALSQAMSFMLAQGFYLAGAGRDQKDAHSPVYLTENGVTISFLGFLLDVPPGIEPCRDCTGPSLYDREAMISSLREMKKRAAYRIVILHWKERELPELSEDELALGREAFNYGADLVLGYGPASAGGLYRVRGKWMIASLGRLTGEGSRSEGRVVDSLLLSAEFTPERMMNLRLTPLALGQGKPRQLPADSAKYVFEKLLAAGSSDVQDNSTLIGDILYLK